MVNAVNATCPNSALPGSSVSDEAAAGATVISFEQVSVHMPSRPWSGYWQRTLRLGARHH